MVALSVEFPREASVTFKVCAAAVTLTISVFDCKVSTKLIVAGWFTRNSASLAWLPNPLAVTVMAYLAGEICRS